MSSVVELSSFKEINSLKKYYSLLTIAQLIGEVNIISSAMSKTKLSTEMINSSKALIAEIKSRIKLENKIFSDALKEIAKNLDQNIEIYSRLG